MDKSTANSDHELKETCADSVKINDKQREILRHLGRTTRD